MTTKLANLIIHDLRDISDLCQGVIDNLKEVTEDGPTPFGCVHSLEDIEKTMERAKTRMMVLCDCVRIG